MSDEQRDNLAETAAHYGHSDNCGYCATVKAFDAAGDQPRIRWCSVHGRFPITPASPVCIKNHKSNPCRVVDAIVVPLPEQP